MSMPRQRLAVPEKAFEVTSLLLRPCDMIVPPCLVLSSQRTESDQTSLDAQRNLSCKLPAYTSHLRYIYRCSQTHRKHNDVLARVITGRRARSILIDSETAGLIEERPGHAEGRGRSASLLREGMQGGGNARRERRRSL